MEYSGYFVLYVLPVFLALPVPGTPEQTPGLAFTKRNVHSGLISPPHPGFHSPGLYKPTTKATTKVTLYHSVSQSLTILSKTLSSSIKSSSPTATKASTSTPSSTALRSNLAYGTIPIISGVTSSVMAPSRQSASSFKPNTPKTLSTTSNFNQTYGTGQQSSGMISPVILSSGLPTVLQYVSTARSIMSNVSANTRLLSTTNSVTPFSRHLSTTDKHFIPSSTEYSITLSSDSTLNTIFGSSKLQSNSLRMKITNTGSVHRLKTVIIATLVFTFSSIIIFLTAVYILRTRCSRSKWFRVAPETELGV